MKDPSAKLPWPYTPTAGAREGGGFRGGSNLYAMTNSKEDQLLLSQVAAGSFDYVASDAGAGHVSGHAVLVVDEPASAYVSARAEVSNKSDRGSTCAMSLLYAGEEVNRGDLTVDNYQDSGSLQLSGMLSLTPGRGELQAEVFCPSDPQGQPRVDALSLEMVFGMSEQPVSVVYAEEPEVADMEEGQGDGIQEAEGVAKGVLWAGPATTPLADIEPAITDLSVPVDLVLQMGQHIDFRGPSHNLHAAIKANFIPSRTGVYRFAIETRSNLCHARASRAYATDDGAVAFSECQKMGGGIYRHPAVHLATDGDNRGIISEPIVGSDGQTLLRVGLIEFSEADVEAGVVLRAEAAGDVGPAARTSGTLISSQYDEGLVFDGGETFVDLVGSKYNSAGMNKSVMGHSPTRDKRAVQDFRILVKGPGDHVFRPLKSSETTR
ncbi:hypothetical protein [Citreimonas salinaria]|uniref:Uncharacterized protein n=1 Tax=Citreimonas salinaria TaxID=321339 RepID=A0A1H3NIB9_9RHOB|nr:hypothetical protein [Citreimonas salinaria]SDY88430.1 hypothetical protein SAMN05444340_12433 [Citreimonas salinaria]